MSLQVSHLAQIVGHTLGHVQKGTPSNIKLLRARCKRTVKPLKITNEYSMNDKNLFDIEYVHEFAVGAAS